MRQRDYFIPKMFYRLMIPSVISSFGFALADMADALVVGQKLGEVGLAAISLCLPLFMLINIFMDGLGVGGSVLFSQKLGEGDVDGARRCFNRTWTAVLVLGCVIGIAVNVFDAPCLRLLGTQENDDSVYYACRDYVKIIAAGAPLLMLNVVFANFLRNDNNAALASAVSLTGNTFTANGNTTFLQACSLVQVVEAMTSDIRNGAYLKNVSFNNCKLHNTTDFSDTGYDFYGNNSYTYFSFLYNDDCISYTRNSNTKESMTIDYSVGYQE